MLFFSLFLSVIWLTLFKFLAIRSVESGDSLGINARR
jgi:hypothetical protein